jgi:transcriptional regulator GlxA family with amidase domain
MAPIHFGTLVYEWQSIDVIGPFDLLNSASKLLLEYVKGHNGVGQDTLERAPEFVFHHIGQDLKPFRLFGGVVNLVPTDTIDNPPELDCLLLGGPIPENFAFPPKYVELIKQHVQAGKKIFTTCTGASALATTGVLDGRKATTNHVEYNWIKAEHPRVHWTRDTKWVVDGNIWTAAGAVAGMDMFAHWISTEFGADVLRAATMGLDYEPRDIHGLHTVLPQRYDSTGNQVSTHVFP